MSKKSLWLRGTIVVFIVLTLSIYTYKGRNLSGHEFWFFAFFVGVEVNITV